MKNKEKPLYPINGIMTSDTKIESFFVFCACAAILLSVHPSLQVLYSSLKISTSIVFAILMVPSLLMLVTLNVQLHGIGRVLALFFFYVCWMLFRAIDSPAFGADNFKDSALGVGILIPLSVLCATIAAKQPKLSLTIVMGCGAAALGHYLLIMFFGGGLESLGGFTSLSNDIDNQNYQFTSFYFGLAGVGLAVAALSSTGFVALSYAIGFMVVVAAMALVGARSSIVALIATALWVFLFKASARFGKTLTIAFVGLLLIGFGATYLNFSEGDGLLTNFVIVDRFLNLADGDDSSQRIRLFSAALEMWFDSATNFIIGGGLGAFPVFIGETDAGWYPHNFILETFAEGGGVGGVALLLIGLSMMRKWFGLSLGRDGFFINCLGALAIYALTCYQFMGGIQSVWIPVFFVALFVFSKPKVSL